MESLKAHLVHLIAALLLVSANTFTAPLRAEVPKVLRVCGDSDEWPPFTYFERSLGKKTNVVAGYNADFLSTLLAGSGRTAVVTLLPWKRCLDRAVRGDFDIVLDGAKTAVREKDFVFPESHYHLTPVVLYRKNWASPTWLDPTPGHRLIFVVSWVMPTISKTPPLKNCKSKCRPGPSNPWL
ncbi:MAG TPA: hypothetical protein VE954_12320 [Oligoflexus sp.]|uniref:substrate-binding periplasmic protein n=1 Tax=Oligoflexus sp. TaxID=1971216 RepID=UPI002D64F843|nr:hypothetical protein [Oligoflexus sp.]HYX33892.1 hypothetical protein [Oligoflexus sp.]